LVQQELDSPISKHRKSFYKLKIRGETQKEERI
jgi:hypothetical protein